MQSFPRSIINLLAKINDALLHKRMQDGFKQNNQEAMTQYCNAINLTHAK